MIAICYQYNVPTPRKLIDYLIQCTIRYEKTLDISLYKYYYY